MGLRGGVRVLSSEKPRRRRRGFMAWVLQMGFYGPGLRPTGSSQRSIVELFEATLQRFDAFHAFGLSERVSTYGLHEAFNTLGHLVRAFAVLPIGGLVVGVQRQLLGGANHVAGSVQNAASSARNHFLGVLGLRGWSGVCDGGGTGGGYGRKRGEAWERKCCTRMKNAFEL